MQLDGHSVLPLVRSNAAPSQHTSLYFQWQNNWAVRRGDWKLIRRGGKFSLRNLSDEDPEVTNYADDNPEIVARLRKLYEAWAKEVR